MAHSVNHGDTHHTHHHGDGELFHTHAPADKMKTAFILTLLVLLAEVVGGILSHSLALLSDAGHVLTDIAAIGLSWYALRQTERPPSEKMTYGYYRAGIVVGLINGVTLIVITLIILWSAYGRFSHPVAVHGGWMFGAAAVGLITNLYLGLSLYKEENINVKSAVLHMLGDAAASAAVIVAGIIINFTHWYVVDPLLSVLIALLISYGAVRIVSQTITILMEGTPRSIHLPDVTHAILGVSGVFDVHDLHVWSITDGKNALSCHVVIDGSLSVVESQSILRAMEHELQHIGIGHVTIQLEDATHPHPESVLCCTDEPTHHHNEEPDAKGAFHP